MRSFARSLSSPVNSPESTRRPGPSHAASMLPGSRRSPSGCTTTRTGSPYMRANSKSRWSCAGTAMTAPAPYSMRTKFAT